MLVTILAIVVVFFVSTSLYVAVAQAKYVYFPDRHLAATPAEAGLAFEDITLTTEDGETIKGWFVPCTKGGEPAARTILFCHGNGGDIGDRIGSLQTFARLGYNTLIFDYRGYGESTGSPTEEGTYKDALACWDYLVDERGLRPSDIIVFGRSLGGAIACWLAAHANPGALVLESVFASAPDMAAMMFPLLPTRLFCRFKYDNKTNVARVRCPVLVAHSRADTTCPYPQAQRVFAAAKEPKLFVEMNGGHNDGGLDTNPEYPLKLVKFLEAHL
jgi:pimeloyl-ACP methyl ester carboxylesterase